MPDHRVYNTVEAKARLNELLNEVVAGGEITIQRRGRPIARLIPTTSHHAADDRQRTKAFMIRLRRFHQRIRKGHGKKGHTVELVRELRDES